jgi:hypothetical protein
MDAGRRMATTLLQRCDVGVPVEVAIRELAPTLSPAAADAARKLVELTAFHFVPGASYRVSVTGFDWKDGAGGGGM